MKPTVAVMIMLIVEMLASGRQKMTLMRRTARMPMTMVTAAEREFSMTLVRNLPRGLSYSGRSARKKDGIPTVNMLIGVIWSGVNG